MNINFNRFANKTVLRALSRIAADAVLGAACAALYGFAFGGMGALAQHETHRLLAITGIFALCGGLGGLALGVSNALLRDAGHSADSRLSASDRAAQKDPSIAEAVRPLALIAQRQSPNSHAA